MKKLKRSRRAAWRPAPTATKARSCVFLHSLVLAALVGLVCLQAYAWPFTRMVGG